MKINRKLRSNSKKSKSILPLRKPIKNKSVKKKKKRHLSRKKLTKTISNSPVVKNIENVSIVLLTYINAN